MDLQSVLSELEASGTEQDRAELAGQGVSGPMYGVNHGALGAFRDKIGTDHSLATSLWETGNHDARMLATLVADVNQVDDVLIEAWSAEAHDSILWGAVQSLADRVRPASSSANDSATPNIPTVNASAPLASKPMKKSKKSGGKKATMKKAAANKGKSAKGKKKSASGKKKAAKPAKKASGKAGKKSTTKKKIGKKSANKAGKKSAKKVAKRSKARKK